MTNILPGSTAFYSCRKKPSSSEHDEIKARIADPYTLTGIDKLRAFYQLQGLEFDEEIFDRIIREYSS